MKIKLLAILFMSVLFIGCSKPLPTDKVDYVGEWQSKEMYLLILQDGTVAYERFKGGGSTSMNGPLKEFIGDDFVVGFAFFTSRFVVNKAPEKINETWTMTVDGIVLTKTE